MLEKLSTVIKFLLWGLLLTLAGGTAQVQAAAPNRARQNDSHLYGPNEQYFVDENVPGYRAGSGANQLPKPVIQDLKSRPAGFSQLRTVSL